MELAPGEHPTGEATPVSLVPVPGGKVASVVTFLEMTAQPAPMPAPPLGDLSLRRAEAPDVGWYRDLFHRIGAEWLWFSRLRISEAEHAAIIGHADVEVHVLARTGADGTRTDIGLVELDFRTPGEAELAFFGLVPGETGAGAGRLMMNLATARAFARPIRRFFVHTCTHDHPAAIGFYQKAGFVPAGRALEIVDDPRLDGTLDRAVAPHIPIIE